MEKSKKTKTTQEDSQKGSQSNPSGLVYWDDYDFENQSVTSGHLEVNYTPSQLSWIEQQPSKLWVLGSSPSGGTIKLNKMPDLICKECKAEKSVRSLTMKFKNGSVYYPEGQCECGEQMEIKNPKEGVPSLGRMNSHGQSY